MSDHELVEDHSAWPTDPFRLLNVSRNIEERELKRAYFKLIKQYKPEHSPAQFQKIRQAFETIDQIIKSRSYDWDNDTDNAVSDEEENDGEATQRDDWPVRADDFLEMAASGRLADAYAQLVNEFELSPTHNGLHLKLFWSLVAAPRLDPKRKPADWLYRGLLARGGRCFPSLELLRRLIDENPTTAFGDEAQALLGPNIDPVFISQFLILRWRSARLLGFWNVIRADMHLLRERAHRDLEPHWPRILSLAAHQVIWSGEPTFESVNSYMSEMASWDLPRGSLDDELDNLDFMIELSASWRTLDSGSEFYSVLRQTLPLLSDSPQNTFAFVVRPLINLLARDPGDTLGMLDQLLRAQPLVFTQVTRIIDRLRMNLDKMRGLETIRLPIRAFVAGTNWSTYEASRGQLLRFCLQEAIDPELFGNVIGDADHFTKAVTENLGPVVAHDWSLQYTFRAWTVARLTLT